MDTNVARKLDGWHSDHVGKEMPIACYGTAGAPMLFFPTAAADYLEYERFRLIDALAGYIDGGLVRVFSIDSINRDAWTNEDVEPAERARRQVGYDRYISEEVVPYIGKLCGDTGIVTTGASFGAYHAMNTLLKHPDQFSGVIAMSGCYDIRRSADGHHDDNVYFNNPIEFIPNLNDDKLLSRIRDARITIVTGQGDYENPDFSREMASVLEGKSIPVNLDFWGHDVKHDWPWWNKMLLHYIPLYFA